MNAVLRVQHDHCGTCGKKRPLFLLVLRYGEKARLQPKPPNVHNGICQHCWNDAAQAIRFEVDTPQPVGGTPPPTPALPSTPHA